MKLRFFILGLIIAAAAFLSAGCGNKDFVFASDIADGATVVYPKYSFKISAAYGGEECEMRVSVNGVLLNPENGRYNAVLGKGENNIKAAAMYSDLTETREYTVIYRADFEISTDIAEAAVVNGSITFRAGATFNDMPCALAAEAGGEPLKGEGEYTAKLKDGENLIVLTARYGDLTARREQTVYSGKFNLITTLTEEDRTEAELSFRAAVSCDGAALPVTVALNGEKTEPYGNRYDMTLVPGVNKIVIAAEKANMKKTYEFSVRYVDDPPVLKTTLKDGKTYRGGKLGFDVTARDGLNQKLPYGNISFAADWEKDGSFAALTGVGKVWDDSAQTSFEINFKSAEFSAHANSPFDFKVTVCDGAGRETSAVYGMTYIPAAYGEKTGEVLFALEGFSIGCGYFIKPCRLPVYEGVNFAETLTKIIEENGWTYANTGTIESGFYLSGITGLDLNGNRIPDGLWALIPESGKYYQSMPAPAEGGYTLSEFCFAQGGGWMYSVNGVYKNFGFSNYCPQDGDAVRVQFTVALGNDLGGGGAITGGITSWLSDNPDYGKIMELLADAAQKIEDGAPETVYNEVLQKITEWNISQKTMDEQIAALKGAYGV